MKYYPQNKDCFICKGYDCPNDEMDTFGWMDCVNYIKSKEQPTENWIHGWLKHNRLVRLLKKKRKRDEILNQPIIEEYRDFDIQFLRVNQND